MGMFTEEPLFEDPNLPAGWYRKVVQRQTGATAGQWDVYVYNPDGKKFRSRNELKAYFLQTGSSLCSEDFDFSVKGKGHHNKGKSAGKKTEVVANSKENETNKKVTPPVANKRSTSKPNVTRDERPKRELRKRPKVEEETVEVEAEDPNDEQFDEPEVSNVKLKVKVGYTATGAMIRPATNVRKKKRRFRNMNVKKSSIKSVPKPTNNTTKKPNRPSSAKEEKSETRVSRPLKKRSKTTEPVAGPSGLQKVKRSPRRILKRKASDGTTGSEDDDDDEDLDYMCSLYPTTKEGEGKKDAANTTGATEEPVPEEKVDQNTSEVTDTNESSESKVEQELNGQNHFEEENETIRNGLPDDNYTVGDMVALEEEVVQHEEVDNDMILVDGQMQVVVIGDSLEVLHNYAKPPSL